MKYTIVRTDTADIGIRKKVMNIARNFDEDIALKKLDDLEKNIYLLEDNPYLGITPRYPVLKRQGYQVLILEKDTMLVRLLQKIWVIGVFLISIQCSIIDIEKGILFL